MKWQKQWEMLLLDDLVKNEIPHERTSFSISPDLKKYRDDDWDKIINSGQILELIRPKRSGAKIKLKSLSQDNLPIEVGTVSFYNDEVNYKLGVVCQLTKKKLEYASGDTRSCLEFDQPIILVAAEELPKSILESKTLNIKSQAKETGCFGFLVFLIGFASLLLS